MRNSTNDARDVLRWRLARGAHATQADIRDLVGAGRVVAVCLYDASASAQPLLAAVVPSGGSCNGKACWKSLPGAGGYRFRSKPPIADGITDVKLRLTQTGELQVVVAGKGSGLSTPPPPFALPVTAQLVVADPDGVSCWEASFRAFVKNDALLFKAKTP